MFVLACVIRRGFEVVDLRRDYHLCNFLGSWVVIEPSWVDKKDPVSQGSEVVISPLCWMMWISAVASLLARSCVGIHGTSQTLCVVSQSVGFLRASIWHQSKRCIGLQASWSQVEWESRSSLFPCLVQFHWLHVILWTRMNSVVHIWDPSKLPTNATRHSLGEKRRDRHRRIVFFFFSGPKMSRCKAAAERGRLT